MKEWQIKMVKRPVQNRYEKLFEIIVIVSVVLSMLTLVIHFLGQGMLFSDHRWYWKECACMLKGVDPAQAIKERLFWNDIGELPESTATLPWMKVIGIIVHGSFLPYTISCIYVVVLNMAFGVITAVAVYKGLSREFQGKRPAVFGVIVMLTSWYLVDWMKQWNNATLVCLLVILAICMMEKHEVMAGVLLGVAMIKPQIVIPFYVVWLLRRKWKAIGVSAAIVIGAWGTSVVITRVGPIEQLTNIFSQAISYDQGFWIYGILDSFQAYGFQASQVMFASMILGIIIDFVLTCLILRQQNKKYPMFYVYVTPAIVSVFWCYKSQCDYNILMIVAIAVTEWWYRCREHSGRQLIIVGSIMFFDLMKPFNLVNGVLGKMGVVNRDTTINLINHVDLYVKTLVTLIFILIVWQMQQREQSEETRGL